MINYRILACVLNLFVGLSYITAAGNKYDLYMLNLLCRDIIHSELNYIVALICQLQKIEKGGFAECTTEGIIVFLMGLNQI